MPKAGERLQFPIMEALNIGSSLRGSIARKWVIGLCLLGLVVVTNGKPPTISIEQPRCEYLENPLGLDVEVPRLSWKLVATDSIGWGQKQTARRILVASSEALLAKNKGDLWDSGVVKTNESQLVNYGGKTLKSGQVCHWKVRVKDENGVWSEWSRPAFWTVGLLSQSDWTASWIGNGEQFQRKPGQMDNTLPDPWLRKKFELPFAPSKAFISVASIGYHELYVNGRKVDDTVLAPCVSDHNHRARYVTYDIGRFLQKGSNAVGLWLGYSWSIYSQYKPEGAPRSPIVIAQADIFSAEGQTLRLATDASWKTKPSANTTIGVWDFTNFGGESFDASKNIPDWNSVAIDDSNWKSVAVFRPKLTLSAQKVEPNRLVREIRPVSIAEPSPGVYRVDMGVNFTGWIEFDLTGKSGDRIEIKFSERKEEAITHRHHSVYIMGSEGKGTFRNHFNYSVGRWIQIEGAGKKPQLSDVRGWLARTDYRRTTQFSCSNPLLNQIYETALYTWENLSLGGYSVDCAQRERMGYGGDAHATTETALDNFSLGAFYTKWSEDWRDVQKADGDLPYTAPTYWGGGGPSWSGYCVTLPWEIYSRYGDRRILEVNFPTIQHWLAFLETKSTNNLLVRWGGEWDFLGDWLWPGAEGVNGNTRETLFLNNTYWVFNLQTAAKIAGVLGHKDIAEQYRQRSQVISQAIHREFFRPEANAYVNGFQVYESVALLTGLPQGDLRKAVWKSLEDEILVTRKGHFFGGITGGFFIIKNLIESNRPDLMFEMVTKEDYPGWGYMLRNGATTLWEDWEGKLSLCHSSYLHVGAWFVEGLAGIRPGSDGSGYQHFELHPGIMQGKPLDWVQSSFDSPYGLIESKWKKSGEKMELEISVPPNTQATAYIPTKKGSSIRFVSGSAGKAPGFKPFRSEANASVIELVPGKYKIEADF